MPNAGTGVRVRSTPRSAHAMPSNAKVATLSATHSGGEALLRHDFEDDIALNHDGMVARFNFEGGDLDVFVKDLLGH